MLNLGLALYSLGKHEAGIETLERFLKAHPSHAPAWLLVGMAQQQLGRPSQAVEPLRRSLALDPANDVARLELADALLASQQAQLAVLHFRALLDRNSDSPKALLGLGASYTELSRRAGEALRHVAPDSAHHQLLLAQSALAQGRYRAAFGHYRAAEARDADAPGLRRGIASVYEKTGHPEWARAELRKRVASATCDSRPLECWFESGDLDRVLRESEGATTPAPLYWSARAFSQKAQGAHERLLALPPSSAGFQLVATMEDLAGRPQDAAEAWSKAVEMEPGDPSLRSQLLHALRAAGLHEESIRQAQALLKRWPKSVEGRFYSGDARLQLGRVEEAIPLLEEAVRMEGDDAEMRVSLATAYLRAGRGAQAVPHLEKALAAGEDERLLFQLSVAQRAAGRPAAAREALERRATLLTGRPKTPAASAITPP